MWCVIWLKFGVLVNCLFVIFVKWIICLFKDLWGLIFVL